MVGLHSRSPHSHLNSQSLRSLYALNWKLLYKVFASNSFIRRTQHWTHQSTAVTTTTRDDGLRFESAFLSDRYRSRPLNPLSWSAQAHVLGSSGSCSWQWRAGVHHQAMVNDEQSPGAPHQPLYAYLFCVHRKPQILSDPKSECNRNLDLD